MGMQAVRERWPLCACGCDEPVHLPYRKFIKGHRPIKPMQNGYVRVWRGPHHPLAGKDGNVLAHRLVLHDAGIAIPDGWNVHHKNGNKQDNRLENLEVLPKSEHHRLHIREAGCVVNQYGTWSLRSAT